MAKITKTEEQLTRDLEVAMKKLYRTLPGTPEEKTQVLRAKFEDEIQQLIQPIEKETVSKKRKVSEKTKVIVDLLRQLKPYAEIAEQCGTSISYIDAISGKNGIYSQKAARVELKQESSKELSNEELADQMGVYPEAIERVRKELEQKRQAKVEEQAQKQQAKAKRQEQKSEPSEEMKAIIDLLRHLKSQTEIAEQYGKAQSYMSIIAKKNGIYSIRAVRKELRQESSKGLSNEELATKMGVYPEAIERVRQELAGKEVPMHTEEPKEVAQPEEQNSQETEQEPEVEFIVQQIVNYGKAGVEVSEIAEKTGISEDSINNTLSENRIWSSQRIQEKLAKPEAKRIPNAIWARWTGVDEETIRRIREEIKSEESKQKEENEVKGERPYTSRNRGFRERLSISRGGRLQITQEADDTKLQDEDEFPVITYKGEAPEYPKNEQELAEKLGISVDLIRPIKSRLSVYPAVAKIAKKYKVSREIVEKILEVVKKEQYDRTHTVVQFESKMTELRSLIARTVKGGANATALEYQVDTLAREFTSFLTKNDYVFLAYGYAKARKYDKAIQFGEEHLGLDVPSISALEQRIQELLQRGLDDKEKQEVAKNFKIFDGGNEYER